MVMTWPTNSISNQSRYEVKSSLRLTVNPATILRGKESNNASNVLWSGASLERAVLSHHALDLVRGPVWSCARLGNESQLYLFHRTRFFQILTM